MEVIDQYKYRAVLSAGAGGWKSVGLPATVDFARRCWAAAHGRRARARRILGCGYVCSAYAAALRAFSAA